MSRYDSDRETEDYDRETFPGHICQECGAEPDQPHELGCGEQQMDELIDELKALASED